MIAVGFFELRTCLVFSPEIGVTIFQGWKKLESLNRLLSRLNNLIRL